MLEYVRIVSKTFRLIHLSFDTDVKIKIDIVF